MLFCIITVQPNHTPFKSDRQRLIGSNISARNRRSRQRALHNCNLVCSGSAGLGSLTVQTFKNVTIPVKHSVSDADQLAENQPAGYRRFQSGFNNKTF